MIHNISGPIGAVPHSMAPVPEKDGKDQLPDSVETITICDSKTLSEAASKACNGREGASEASPGLFGGWEKIKNQTLQAAKAGDDILDNHPIIKASLNNAEQLIKSLKAFPKFIYPSFSGMTSEEAHFVLGVLDKIPLKDLNSITRLEMLPAIKNASGLAYQNPALPLIQLSREQMNISPKWFEEVVIHETGHTKDYSTALFGIFKHESSTNNLWGSPPYISNYAKTNHWEDFAESYANYHVRPEQLKAECPEKYARIEEMEKLGTFDKLIDQKAFRETGKYIGEKLGDIPYLRSGVSILSFALGFLQIARGVGEWEKASQTGDLQKKMDGTMDIAAGTCFASRLFCIPGLAIDGAKKALDRAIEQSEITAAQANAVVQNTVGVIGGPIAALGHWIKSKFSKKSQEQAAAQNSQAAAPAKQGAGSDCEKEINIGTLARAVSVAIGGAAGSLAGGVIGPYMGLMAGFSVAGPLGGTVGLVAGALIGVYALNRVGGELGSKVGDLIVTAQEKHHEKEGKHKTPETTASDIK
ncbi:MAG: hypothetical protein AB9903_29005 [Vulcanimicrobiota bacterium]